MQTVIPLEPGHYYHIYDRGTNRSNIFVEDRNYAYFIQLYARYVAPVADTFAYCLLRNHFHVLVQIRRDRRGLGDRAGPVDRRTISHAFNNLLNAYAKAINKAYGRTGSLFQHHFGRLPVASDRYFAALVHYIHHNPQKHGYVNDFREWPHSSYCAILSDKPTQIERTAVLDWFGGRQAFQQFHATTVDESFVGALIGEDET